MQITFHIQNYTLKSIHKTITLDQLFSQSCNIQLYLSINFTVLNTFYQLFLSIKFNQKQQIEVIICMKSVVG